MTENEAIERLKCMRLFLEISDKQNENKFLEDDYIANKIAIQALKEIQQYRAIGTIEEFKALKEKSVAKKQGNINDFDSHLKLSKAGFLCCSSTNKNIRYPLISLSDLDHCPRCGQKLDWQ